MVANTFGKDKAPEVKNFTCERTTYATTALPLNPVMKAMMEMDKIDIAALKKAAEGK